MYLRNAYITTTNEWATLTQGGVKSIIRSLEVYNPTDKAATIHLAFYTDGFVESQYGLEEIALPPGDSAILWQGLQMSLPPNHKVKAKSNNPGIKIVVNVVEL